MYRIGYPFWKQFARLGVHMKIQVKVVHDSEAGVFVATSDDLSGLVVEAVTVEELAEEVRSGIATLMEFHLHRELPAQPVADMRLCPA